jgi:hypothetical protein
MSAPVPEFARRSESAWFAACAAALPPAALQIFFEARARGGYQVDAADAWIAFTEQKSESQARSKARREHVKGWGTGAALRDDETEHDPIDPITPPPGMGEWALHQDPADARALMEIRSALENCDALAALKALGLGLDLAQQEVGRLNAELRRWAALDDLAEADAGAIALRDRVTRRMAQMALKAQREAVEHGQGVLL